MPRTFETLVEVAVDGSVYDQFNALWVARDPDSWRRLQAVASDLVHYVLRNKQIPVGKEGGLERASRAFLSAKLPPLDFDKWLSSNTPSYLFLSATQDWFDREDGNQRFQVGSFVVYNSVGLPNSSLLPVQKLLLTAEKSIKQSGIRNALRLLYGDVILGGQMLGPRNLAYYQPKDDLIVLRYGRVMAGEFNLLHEIGHRYYERVMGSREKNLWLAWDSHLRRKEVNFSFPDVGDSLPFTLSGFGEGTVVTNIRAVKGTIRFYVTDTAFVTAAQIRNWYSENGVALAFPTVYAKQDPEEHFCEAFALYCQKKLPEPHNTKFLQLFSSL